MKKQNVLLHKLINAGQGKVQLAFAAAALGIGTLLLLIAVQAYVDVNTLLYGAGNKNDMADFLIINKKITNAMMGHRQSSLFSAEEIRQLQEQPFVQAVGKISSNTFRVSASAGRTLPFSTDLFFEAVPDSFLDQVPDRWHWQPGDQLLPVILSSDFLSLYNYGFALSQGLPQLSAESIKAIPITITISNSTGSASFLGNITGFSDRISSILVPQSFMEWANDHYGHAQAEAPPSRLILKVRDPSDPAFVHFLQEHHYVTSQDKLKFSKTRLIIQTVVTVIGAFGLLILLLSMIIFSIYIRLVVSRSKEEIRLLGALGYSPTMLSRFLLRRMIPLYAAVIILSLIVTVLLQLWIHGMLAVKQLSVDPFISYTVLAAAAIMLAMIYLVNRRSVRQSIKVIQ